MLKYLISNKLFWLSTGGTLVLLVVLLVFVYPPQIRQYQSHKDEIVSLDTQISDNEKYLATLKTLEKSPDDIKSLYDKASELLPVKPEPEILILQLSGLLNSLGLAAATTNVPFGSGAVNEANNTTAFTITGDMSFDAARNLVEHLKTFSRWNKIVSVEFSQKQDGGLAIILNAETYSKPDPNKEFSGLSKLLDQAKEAFNANQSYTTIPDVTTEGNYGRSNPFAPL